MKPWSRRKYELEQGGNLVRLFTLNPENSPKLNYTLFKIVLRKDALRI